MRLRTGSSSERMERDRTTWYHDSEMSAGSGFRDDLRKIYLRRLNELGWSVSLELSLKDLGVEYYELIRRHIAPIPRNVYLSDRVNAATQYRDAIAVIVSKFEQGGSLTPYLSRSIERSGSRDPMMADWGIHHLHLGTSIEHHGFTTRTGDIVLAKVDLGNAYLIDILPHGPGHLPWTETDIFETIHRNWPHLTSAWSLPSIVAGDKRLSPTEHQQLRKAGIASFVTLSDGTVLMPSMGVTTARTSGESIDLVARDWQVVKTLENMLGPMGVEYILVEVSPPHVRIRHKSPRGHTLSFVPIYEGW